SLGKILEEFELLFRSHTDAGIADAESDPVLVPCLTFHIHCDRSVIREFARIAEKVEQDWPDFRDIGLHGTDVIGQIHDNPGGVLLAYGLQSRNDFFDYRLKIEGLEVDSYLSSFH